MGRIVKGSAGLAKSSGGKPSSKSGPLKRVGLKKTMPRTHVLRVLEQKGQGKHLSAEGVHQELLNRGEEIGIATIYRVLTQFEAAGLVIRHHFGSGPALFELDEGEHHDHMICLESGKVIEFKNEEIEKIQREIAVAYGYELADHSLVLYVRPRKGRSRH